jgi:carbon-monoxide dehydrogenase medium subunit
MAPPLLVLDANLIAISEKGERKIAIGEFFLGPEKTVLERGEILKDIQVRSPAKNVGTAFLKVRRTGVDLAIVNVAVALTVSENKFNNVKIALGGVAPTPMRAAKAEEQLKGKECTDENIEAAAETAASETKPIADVRSTAEYRREVSKVLVRRAVKNALGKIGGG